MPIHLHPTAEIAPSAIIPGDPGRAMAIAQALLDQPRMANHHRGLWGYSGAMSDGTPLTVQATGMGGPSAAIVFEELSRLGVERAIRVGSTGALTAEVALGDTLVVDGAIAADGTSGALGAEGLTAPDPGLTGLLAAAAPGARRATVASTDLFYDPREGVVDGWLAEGAVAVEMECAPLFTLGPRLGIAVACILVVSDLAFGEQHARLADDELQTVAVGAAEAAARALAQSAGTPSVS